MNNAVTEAQPERSQRLWRYGPLIFWMVFISFASTGGFSSSNTSPIIGRVLLWFVPVLTEAQLVTVNFIARKLGHFTEYAVLAFLAYRAFSTSTKLQLRRYWFQLGLLLVVGYALLDEFHQYFVPSRTASIYDSAIDIAGGLTVLLLYKLREKRTQPT